jgi:flagellar biosynthesis protein FlhA
MADARKLNEWLTDELEISLSPLLVLLVDHDAGGDLLERVVRMRQALQDILLHDVPPIRIRDRKELHPHEYAFHFNGRLQGSDFAYPDRLLASGTPQQLAGLHGKAVAHPVTGTPGVWIAPGERMRAVQTGCTVEPPSELIVSHFQSIYEAESH